MSKATANRRASERAWLAAIVAARRAGQPIAVIAERAGVTKQRVSQLTKDAGGND